MEIDDPTFMEPETPKKAPRKPTTTAAPLEIVRVANDLPEAAEETQLEIVRSANDLPARRISWKAAKALQAEYRNSGITALAAKILLGVELARLRELMGETRGVGETGSFADAAKENLGVGKTAVYSYIELAEGCAGHCKQLADMRASGASPDKMLPVIAAVVAGKNKSELLIEWGLEEPETEPDGTKKLGGKTAGSIGRPAVSEETLTAETVATWTGLLQSITAETELQSFARLPDGLLSDVAATFAEAKERVEKAIKGRKGGK